MDQIERILIVRPSALGDVCRSVPALASVRAAFPEAEIDWLVRDVFADAVSAHPMLTRTVPFARGELRAWWRSPRAAGALRTFVRSLRGARYDLVLDLQGLARSGFFTWATGARRRVGLADARELGWLGLNERVRTASEMHTVDRMLAVVEGAGVPVVRDLRLYTAPAWRERSEELGGVGRYGVLAPTSAWEGKRWPAERFRDVARDLLDRGLVERLVLVGGRGEREQCAALTGLAASDPRVLDAIGKTSVGELMALIERASIVIANDSAAAHMAVGFDRALVGLYGPTRVDRVGPYRREADVLQAGASPVVGGHKNASAGRAMMEQISVQQVVAAAEQRLTGAAPARV